MKRHVAGHTSFVLCLAPEEVAHNENNVCRTLGEPSHEVRIPLVSIRDVNSHIIALCSQVGLLFSPDPVEHLELETRAVNPSLLGELLCVLYEPVVVGRESWVVPFGEQ